MARWRTARRRMHVGVAQPIGCKCVEIGRPDRATITAQMAEPVSSSTMYSTFGAPSLARMGAGQEGCEMSMVRPVTPLNACPALYSFSGISKWWWPPRSRKSAAAYASTDHFEVTEGSRPVALVDRPRQDQSIAVDIFSLSIPLGSFTSSKSKRTYPIVPVKGKRPLSS